MNTLIFTAKEKFLDRVEQSFLLFRKYGFRF